MDRLPLFPDLEWRATVPELMDSPESDPRELARTLRLFGLVNRTAARVRYVLKKNVIRVMQQAPDRQYHLIDLGAGACETAAWLLEYSRKRGLDLRVTACDHDPRVVQHARDRFGNVPGLTIRQRDILTLDDLKPVRFIYANHLMHHMSDGQLIHLLRYLARFEAATVVVDDLRRSRLAYTVFYIVSALLPYRGFVRHDGLVSIMKGFRRAEFRTLIRTATPDIEGLYCVRTLFPCRIVVLRKPTKQQATAREDPVHAQNS